MPIGLSAASFWNALCASAMALCMLPATCWAVDDGSQIRVIITSRQGAVEVTGVGPPRTIVGAGSVRAGEWVQPTPGTIAWVVRGSGLAPLPHATRTQIAAVPAVQEASPGQRAAMLEHFVALVLPKAQWSLPGGSKGDEDHQASLFRVLYPRDSKVADPEPVLAWAGGGDRFEVRLYRRGVDAWVWRHEVQGSRRTKLPAAQQLAQGTAYAWEVRDLRNPSNVSVATFETPTPGERQRLQEGLRQARAACDVTASSSVNCALALAGFYRKEGYVYEAIRTLEALRSSTGPDRVVESLLRGLDGLGEEK